METAAAALQALATSGNHPIGQPQGGTPDIREVAPRPPAASNTGPVQAPTRGGSGGSRGGFSWIFIPILAGGVIFMTLVVAVAWIVIKVIKGNRR
jgi:hypothetical protein